MYYGHPFMGFGFGFGLLGCLNPVVPVVPGFRQLALLVLARADGLGSHAPPSLELAG